MNDSVSAATGLVEGADAPDLSGAFRRVLDRATVYPRTPDCVLNAFFLLRLCRRELRASDIYCLKRSASAEDALLLYAHALLNPNFEEVEGKFADELAILAASGYRLS